MLQTAGGILIALFVLWVLKIAALMAMDRIAYNAKHPHFAAEQERIFAKNARLHAITEVDATCLLTPAAHQAANDLAPLFPESSPRSRRSPQNAFEMPDIAGWKIVAGAVGAVVVLGSVLALLGPAPK
jgi:hypothetical protein